MRTEDPMLSLVFILRFFHNVSMAHAKRGDFSVYIILIDYFYLIMMYHTNQNDPNINIFALSPWTHKILG